MQDHTRFTRGVLWTLLLRLSFDTSATGYIIRQNSITFLHKCLESSSLLCDPALKPRKRSYSWYQHRQIHVSSLFLSKSSRIHLNDKDDNEASNNDENNNTNNDDNNPALSNAERERREEEKRRKARKDDVVINQTSAKKGAKDFPINPQATQEEWLRQASTVEQQIYQLTNDGMESIRSLQLVKADQAFNEVFRLKPDAYLWQAGIVKFYLGDLIGAASIFARNAKTYERNPIMGPATEERIWRDACQLMYLTLQSRAERKRLIKLDPDAVDGIKSIIPQIADDDDDEDEDDDDDDDLMFSSSKTESRKVFRLVRELFSGKVDLDKMTESVARGQLRYIAGSFDDIETAKADKKMWKLTAWFYLGLYNDVIGKKDEARKCMKMAMHLSLGGGKSSDIVQTLPLLHMTAREWFDDDDFDEDPLQDGDGWDDEHDNDDDDDTNGTDGVGSSTISASRPLFLDEYETDPVLEATVMEGISNMTIRELRDALRKRGLKVRGSKQELLDRLFYSMMDDSGYQSGFAP